MSLWFVVLSAIAASNPPRVAERLSATPHDERARPLSIGVVILALALAVVAGLASQILDVLELSDETWRIATGAVAVLAGARVVVAPLRPVPGLRKNTHALVPVVFPVMFVPELVLLMVLWGATEGFRGAAVALVVVVAALRLWAPAEGGPVTRGAAKFLAALLVVVGVGLLVAGIRDV